MTNTKQPLIRVALITKRWNRDRNTTSVLARDYPSYRVSIINLIFSGFMNWYNRRVALVQR